MADSPLEHRHRSCLGNRAVPAAPVSPPFLAVSMTERFASYVYHNGGRYPRGTIVWDYEKNRLHDRVGQCFIPLAGTAEANDVVVCFEDQLVKWEPGDGPVRLGRTQGRGMPRSIGSRLTDASWRVAAATGRWSCGIHEP